MRFGLEVEDCLFYNNGHAGANGNIIARPGTNGNCLSLRVRRTVIRDTVSGAGIHNNSLTNPADIWIEECVFSGNQLHGVYLLGTGGSVTLVRNQFWNNGTGGSGSGLHVAAASGGVLVENNIFDGGGLYGVEDTVIEPGVTTGRLYRNNIFYDNAAGQFNAAILDVGGGEGVMDCPGIGNRSLSVSLESVSRGLISGFGKRETDALNRIRREFVGGHSQPGVGLSDSARALRGMMR